MNVRQAKKVMKEYLWSVPLRASHDKSAEHRRRRLALRGKRASELLVRRFGAIGVKVKISDLLSAPCRECKSDLIREPHQASCGIGKESMENFFTGRWNWRLEDEGCMPEVLELQLEPLPEAE